MTLLQRDRQNREEGRIEGRHQMLIELVDDGMLTMEEATAKAEISKVEFKELFEGYKKQA